jgi:hypothetical protein
VSGTFASQDFPGDAPGCLIVDIRLPGISACCSEPAAAVHYKVPNLRNPVALGDNRYHRPGTVHRFANTTDVIAAIEDILGMGRLSKFDYFSRSLADIFAPTPDLTPYDPITPTHDLNEKNPPNTAATRMSEGLDLSVPDRVDDQVQPERLVAADLFRHPGWDDRGISLELGAWAFLFASWPIFLNYAAVGMR